MNIVAHNVASKLFVAFVAVAMLFTLATPAKAATAEELQQMINQLLAQVASLQAQVGQGGQSVASGVCPFTWTRSLSQGSTGADVMKLQQFLNADAETRVAASGVGSVGAETEYYGPATAAAVSKFQVKYRSEVLSPSGLVNPTGYFGPSSMAKANMLCASAPVVVPPTTGDDTSDDSDDTTSAGLQGEGELATFEVDDDETEAMEGEEDVVVMVLTVEAENGDLELDRVTFTLVGTGNDEEDPWDVFEEVSLWVDGDKIADMDASDEDEYLDEDAGEFRFSNLGLVLPEDDEMEIFVAVSVTGSVDGAGTAADWELAVTEVRYFDADDVATDDNSTDDLDPTTPPSETFEIVEEGTDDGADIESSSNNPDGATLLVDEDSDDSDEYTVHIFDIDVDKDSSDLEVGDTYVEVTISNPATNADILGGQKDVIDSIFMTIDGVTVEGEADNAFAGLDDDDTVIASSSDTTVAYVFEFDGDVVLEGDEEYEVEVAIVFKGQDGNYENGVTVETDVDGADWEVEGLANDDELSGTDGSEDHTLSTVVPVVSDVDSYITQANNVSNSGSITFEFTIEADGDEDVVFTRAELDAEATLTSSASTSLAKPTPSLTRVSGDAVEAPAGTWTIADGDEASFRLTYTFTTASDHNDGNYSINLDSIVGVEVDETSPDLPLAH